MEATTAPIALIERPERGLCPLALQAVRHRARARRPAHRDDRDPPGAGDRDRGTARVREHRGRAGHRQDAPDDGCPGAGRGRGVRAARSGRGRRAARAVHARPVAVRLPAGPGDRDREPRGRVRRAARDRRAVGPGRSGARGAAVRGEAPAHVRPRRGRHRRADGRPTPRDPPRRPPVGRRGQPAPAPIRRPQ